MTDYFAHDLALVDTDQIGSGTRIWAWAHVLAETTIGSDCNIGEHCFIESGVRLGDRVTVKNGVSLWTGVVVGDDVFIGPHAVFTNDIRPRSRVYDGGITSTALDNGCSIGANATIVAGNSIGRYALVGAGAVVTSDVPDHALVYGNPARRHGSVCVCSATLRFDGDSAACTCGRQFRLKDGEVRWENRPPDL